MLLVPIKNDIVKSSNGLPSKVLSFTNYKKDGPAVIVNGGDVIYFSDITEINDHKVKLIKTADGYNVFETSGFVERKFQLPQVGETISVDQEISTLPFKVKRLKLHVQDELASGLIVECEKSDSKVVVPILLSQIADVDGYIFSRKKFLAYYEDYSNKGHK
jgi:hypothetical protein